MITEFRIIGFLLIWEVLVSFATLWLLPEGAKIG